MTRTRILHVIVQPVLVTDDGDELAPGPSAQAFPVPLAELDGLAAKLRADIATMNEQADTERPATG